ncbi:hypothetical protein ND814_19200 [Leptospira bandrabouensis]|uniref:hypothetical protein n=1 Tax=Leptospira bandrabouensis TaxID=2484903 RepID=UPI00223D97AD|nr:hypothetical protein [Leptospira bandrabouensis]MCW7460408.1 hypothetical protein [Leptospira bandrabouensis]MCW7487118.1 hypothetical protein [Leptospira bandrabouensis]
MKKVFFEIIEDNLLPWKFFIHESKNYNAIEWIKRRSIPWKTSILKLNTLTPEPQCLNVSSRIKILRWYGQYEKNRIWVIIFALNNSKTIFLTILSPLRIIFCLSFYLFFSRFEEAFFFSLVPTIFYYVIFQNEYYENIKKFLRKAKKEI